MSRNPVQKFCKVCQDAGKSEAEYKSHFTRESPDPHSKVVCPLLLSLNCRFCNKNGHTVKYCPTLKKKEKAEKYSYKTPIVSKAPVKVPVKTKNAFMCLDCSSDEEVEAVEEFPELAPKKTQVTVGNGFSYADALSKPATVKPATVKPATVKPVVEVQVVETLKPKGITTKPAPWASNTTTSSKWAAFDDDSEEDEEEEEEEQLVYNDDLQDDTW